MEAGNTQSSQAKVSYNIIIEMIETDRIIRIPYVLNAVQNLLKDAQDGMYQYDEDGKESYTASVHYKMKKLSDYFSDSTLTCQGSADDFHNLAVAYAKQDLFMEACKILQRGIALRGSAVDLLADYLLYGRKDANSRSQCQKYYEVLQGLPLSTWNWRAYSFSIDHLLEGRNYVSDVNGADSIKDNAVKIAKEFIKRFSKKNADREHLDRAYSDLSEVYRTFGDSENEYKTLKRCVENYKRMPLSSMRLAEIEFSKGNYFAVSDNLTNCTETLEIQPSFSQGYIYLLMAHSNASFLFSKDNKQTAEEKKSLVKKIYRDLDTAEGLVNNSTYEASIQTLRKILEKQWLDEEYSEQTRW